MAGLKKLRSYWLIEAVRLKESQWGPLEDTAETRKALASGTELHERMAIRAQLLAQRQGWLGVVQRLQHLLSLSGLALIVLFLLLGVAAGTGALAGSRQINVLAAFSTLLFVPTASLLVWLGALGLSRRGGGSTQGISGLGLKLTQRLSRGPDQALLLNALLSVLQRYGLLRWGTSSLNHAVWLVALVAALATVVVLLATQRYSFSWETTLLLPQTVVQLVQGLAWLPGGLGFSMPSAELINQSDGLHSLPASAQIYWSHWLVGSVVVYGIVPRVLALGYSVWRLRQAYKRMQLDSSLLGLIELKSRLMPTAAAIGIDAQAGADQVPQAISTDQRPSIDQSTLLVGIELPQDTPWPPVGLAAQWEDAGHVDDRAHRAQLLDRLSQQPYTHLVLVASATHTPDRGVIAWLGELASYAEHSSVLLLNTELNADGSLPSRLQAWQQRLHKAGFNTVYLHSKDLIDSLNHR